MREHKVENHDRGKVQYQNSKQPPLHARTEKKSRRESFFLRDAHVVVVAVNVGGVCAGKSVRESVQETEGMVITITDIFHGELE